MSPLNLLDALESMPHLISLNLKFVSVSHTFASSATKSALTALVNALLKNQAQLDLQ